MATNQKHVSTRARKRPRVQTKLAQVAPVSGGHDRLMCAAADLDRQLIARLQTTGEHWISDLRAQWERLTADVGASRTVLKADVDDLLYDSAMCAAVHPGRVSPSPQHYMALAKILTGAVKLSDKTPTRYRRMEDLALLGKLSLYEQEAKKAGIKNAGGKVAVRKVAIERLARETRKTPAAIEQSVTRAIKSLALRFPQLARRRPRRKPLRVKARHD